MPLTQAAGFTVFGVDVGPDTDQGPLHTAGPGVQRANAPDHNATLIQRYVGSVPEGLVDSAQTRLDSTMGMYVLTHALSPVKWQAATTILGASNMQFSGAGDAGSQLAVALNAIPGDLGGTVLVAPIANSAASYTVTTKPVLPPNTHLIISPGAVMDFAAGLDCSADVHIEIMVGGVLRVGGPGIAQKANRLRITGFGKILRLDSTVSPLVSATGAAGARLVGMKLFDVTLDNNGVNAPCMSLKTIDRVRTRDVLFDNSPSAGIYQSDTYDVQHDSPVLANVGSIGASTVTTVRGGIHIDDAVAACRKTTINDAIADGGNDTAVVMRAATAGTRHNGLSIKNLAVETHSVRSLPPAVYIQHVDNVDIDVNAVIGNFAAGVTTAQDVVSVADVYRGLAKIKVDGVDASTSIRTLLRMSDVNGFAFDLFGNFNATSNPTMSMFQYVGSCFNVLEGAISAIVAAGAVTERNGAPSSFATLPVDEPLAVSVSTTATLDMQANSIFFLTLAGAAGARPVTLNNWPPGLAATVTVIVKNDGTGGKSPTFAGVKWPGGLVPTPTTGANSIDVYVFMSPDGGTTVIGAQTVSGAA